MLSNSLKFLTNYGLEESNSEEGITSIFLGNYTYLSTENLQGITVTETDIVCLTPNAIGTLTDSCRIPLNKLDTVIQSLNIMYAETENLLALSTALPKNKKLTRTERLAYQDSASVWIEYKLKLSSYLQNLANIKVALVDPSFKPLPNIQDYIRKLTAPNNNGYTVSSVVISC